MYCISRSACLAQHSYSRILWLTVHVCGLIVHSSSTVRDSLLLIHPILTDVKMYSVIQGANENSGTGPELSSCFIDRKPFLDNHEVIKRKSSGLAESHIHSVSSTAGTGDSQRIKGQFLLSRTSRLRRN